MNEIVKNIKNRRSTRKFLQTKLKKEELDTLIECGTYSPSGNNGQPWYFTVVQDKELIDEISFQIKEELKKSSDEQLQKLGNNNAFHIFYDAPSLIIVSGETSSPSVEKDCSAAIQNILLGAESLDLGSCWIGFMGVLMNSEKAEKYIEKLAIPEGHKIIDAVALGYKKLDTAKAPKRKEDIVKYL